MPQVWLQSVSRGDRDNHSHSAQSPEGTPISSNYFSAVDSQFPQLSGNKQLLKGTWHCWAKGPGGWATAYQFPHRYSCVDTRPSRPSSNSTKCRLISEGAVKFPLWPETLCCCCVSWWSQKEKQTNHFLRFLWWVQQAFYSQRASGSQTTLTTKWKYFTTTSTRSKLKMSHTLPN